jgi:hypothetical protein
MDLWCDLLHDKPMWPINGRYQCRTCLRYRPVRWEQIGQVNSESSRGERQSASLGAQPSSNALSDYKSMAKTLDSLL